MEHVGHLVMRCTYVEEEREKLEEPMSERVKEWQGMDDNVQVRQTWIGHVEMKLLEGQRRFAEHGPHPPRH